MINITISNKAFYTFVVVAILLVTSGFVYAFNSGADPSVMGHSGDEIKIDCVSVYYSEGEADTGNLSAAYTGIYQLGTTYTFDEVATASLTAKDALYYPVVNCKDNEGWIMTGCSSGTSGTAYDNDESMGTNSCKGDQHGVNVIYTRCCKFG